MSCQPIKRLAWSEVMAGLTGERLALLDDMIRRGVVQSHDAETARWLRYHRFAYMDELDGLLRARPIEQAQRLWEFDGPCLLAALPEPKAKTPEPEPQIARRTEAESAATEEPRQVHQMSPQLSFL